MRSDGDWMSARQAAAHLEKIYLDWMVSTARGRGGVRFVAIHDGLAPGLHALIGSYEEVRTALEADRRERRRRGHWRAAS